MMKPSPTERALDKVLPIKPILISLPPLSLANYSQILSSPSGPFQSTTPSQGKIWIIVNSATTPGSRSNGTNPTQTSLFTSARASEKYQTAQHNVSKSPTPSTSYGTGMFSPTTAKKSPTTRSYMNSNPTRWTKTAHESTSGSITSSTPEMQIPKLAPLRQSNWFLTASSLVLALDFPASTF